MATVKGVKERFRRTLALGPALRTVWESAPRLTLVNLGLVIVQAGLPLAALYLTKLIVDALSSAVSSSGGGGDLSYVFLLIGLAAVVGLFTAGAGAFAGFVTEAQSHMVTDHVLGRLHEKSTAIDLQYYEAPRYYDTLHRAQQEAPQRPPQVLQALLQVARSALTLIGVLGLLFGVHWLLPLVLFLAAVPGFFVRYRFADEMYGWQRRRAATERKASYLDRLLVHPMFAKEIRVFGLGDVIAKRFRSLRDRLREEKLAIAWRRTAAQLVVQGGTALAVFLSYGWVAYLTFQGSLSLGSLVMYFGAVQKGQSVTESLLGACAGLYEHNLFFSYLEEFLGLEPRIQSPPNPKAVSHRPGTGFALRGVGFSYPRSDRPALRGVDLRIAPGEMVALVGPNGSGKSTIVKLLTRLYDPRGGRVTLDGVDLREYDLEGLRRTVSVVFQDFVAYQLTARENIWFGDVQGPMHGRGVAEAARKTGAAEVLEGLENGYDTTLGYWFEEARDLSGGEWQKVALARALFSDARLLILDEPASSLDPRAEARLFQTLADLETSCSVLLVSHRLSSVRVADRIYVLEEGEIRESGSYEALLERRGTLADLVDVQRRTGARSGRRGDPGRRGSPGRSSSDGRARNDEVAAGAGFRSSGEAS